MTNIDKAREAYQNDPVIHNVVNMLTNLIEEAHLSPHEVRAIAMFAVLRYEERRPFAVPMMGGGYETGN